MLSYNGFISSSNSYKLVMADVGSGRVSHAYLFVSADENYLAAFAEQFAKTLINQNSDTQEKNNLRIANHTHPDVVFFGGAGKKIDVAAAKDLVSQAQVSPFESDKKIFVLAGAADMNEASQNAILKTIEEPPKNTYFLMCATGITKLLPTILSRVKKIDLDEIPAAEIKAMLVSGGVEEKRAELCAGCASGNASFAEKLALDDGFNVFFDQIISCLFEINGSRDVLKYSAIFTAKNVDYNEFFDVCLLALRDLQVLLAGKEELVVLKNVLPKLKVIASSLNLESLSLLIGLCIESKKDLSFNASPVAVVDKFLFKLAEVKVKCRRL